MKQSKMTLSITNWVPKIFSFLIALFIVLAVKLLNITDRVVTLPLQVTLPENLSPASLVPDTVEIAISGPDSIIYLVNPDEITASADFSEVTAPGITRVPVELEYHTNIFTEESLTITSRPTSVRILFE